MAGMAMRACLHESQHCPHSAFHAIPILAELPQFIIIHGPAVYLCCAPENMRMSSKTQGPEAHTCDAYAKQPMYYKSDLLAAGLALKHGQSIG